MHWTPAVILQAEDRIHRLGQKEKISVNYHYLYGEGTLDSLLYEKLQTKLAIVSDMLNGKAERLEVVEQKGLGDFNSVEKSPKVKKCSDSTPKTYSPKTATSDKKCEHHNQKDITSYFIKKEIKFDDLVTQNDEVDSNQKLETRSDASDEWDWDQVDQLLEEERARSQISQVISTKLENKSDKGSKYDGEEKEEEKKGDNLDEDDETFLDCIEEILKTQREKETQQTADANIVYEDESNDIIIIRNPFLTPEEKVRAFSKENGGKSFSSQDGQSSMIASGKISINKMMYTNPLFEGGNEQILTYSSTQCQNKRRKNEYEVELDKENDNPFLTQTKRLKKNFVNNPKN